MVFSNRPTGQINNGDIERHKADDNSLLGPDQTEGAIMEIGRPPCFRPKKKKEDHPVLCPYSPIFRCSFQSFKQKEHVYNDG